MNDHPTSQELFEAAGHYATDATDRHIASCLRCQVLVSRLSETELAIDPSPATTSALREHSPTVRPIAAEPTDVQPAEGDVWRTQGPASLLLWIRKVIDSETVDAVPLTLDLTLADSMSLIVGSDRTSWACDTVLLLDYRTHIHIGALAAKVGSVDAGTSVQRVLDGDLSLSSHATGAPIHDLSDQRLEYRDLLRFELSTYAPSIWAESHPPVPEYWNVPIDELSLRLDGIAFTEWSGLPRVLAPGVELVPCLRSAYLGSIVLICRLTDPNFLRSTPRIIDACRSIVADEHDADAVAIFAANESQDSVVVRRADMRRAIGLPSGATAEPEPYLADLPLLDILFKHFDRYAFAISWSADDEMPELKQRDLNAVASEQVRKAAEHVARRGRAARQPAKTRGYDAAVNSLDAVEALVLRALRGDIDAAMQRLTEDDR